MTWNDFLPMTIVGIALIALAIYLLITNKMSVLIGMQANFLKSDLKIVSRISALFLFGMSVCTLLLPLAEKFSPILLIIDLGMILLLVLSLFYYLHKQRIK